MRVLVTGAGGQLGTALRELSGASGASGAGAAAAAAGNEWLFTDLAESAWITRALNITDAVAVENFFAHWRPDVVINCAAFTDVDRAETDREAAFLVNRDAPHFLARAAARADAAMIHISTDFVFSGRNADGGFLERSRPYTEDDVPSPLNVYGESKLAGELAVIGSGVRGAVVRTSWLYSPWGRNFVKSILRAASTASASTASSDPAEIRVVSDQSGSPTSALSLAASIVKMVPEATHPAGIYHFCDSGVVSRADFAVEIIRRAGLSCRVKPVCSDEYPSPAARPAYSALDTSKITRTFGIVPRPWQEPLAECITTLNDGR